jgi:tRNA-dihydrouridine synthase
MRVVARRRGCAYAVTEALLDVILCNGGEGLRRSIDIDDEDHPVAGQVIGSEPATMARAACLLQQAGYDVIDLNFACPVKKIKNKARGGHMLFDVTRARRYPQVRAGCATASGSDDGEPAARVRRFERIERRFYEILERAWEYGYAAVRVHGRTVEQKYLGRAKWDVLREVKRRYPDRTILGSGDVFTAEDAVRMLKETGVDIVWIARGAIGNPWIFRHAAMLLAGESLLSPPTIHEQRDALAEHFGLAMQIHGEQLRGAPHAEDGDQVQPVSPAGRRGEALVHRGPQPSRLDERAGSLLFVRRPRRLAGAGRGR